MGGLGVARGSRVRWVCDPYDRYDVIYEKNWRIIEENSEYLMMRFVDQGTLIGQVR